MEAETIGENLGIEIEAGGDQHQAMPGSAVAFDGRESARARVFGQPAIDEADREPMVAQEPVHRPEGFYYLRYWDGKKRIFERVGSNAELALAAQDRREKSLGARSVGLVIANDLSPRPQTSRATPC